MQRIPARQLRGLSRVSCVPFPQRWPPPPAPRKVIYTTNAIESLNMRLRKLTSSRRILPNGDAVFKTMCLAINEASRKWKMIYHWKPALQVFQVMFGDERVPVTAL